MLHARAWLLIGSIVVRRHVVAGLSVRPSVRAFVRVCVPARVHSLFILSHSHVDVALCLQILRDTNQAKLDLECEDVHTAASGVKQLESRRAGLTDDQSFQDERIEVRACVRAYERASVRVAG